MRYFKKLHSTKHTNLACLGKRPTKKVGPCIVCDSGTRYYIFLARFKELYFTKRTN